MIIPIPTFPSHFPRPHTNTSHSQGLSLFKYLTKSHFAAHVHASNLHSQGVELSISDMLISICAPSLEHSPQKLCWFLLLLSCRSLYIFWVMTYSVGCFCTLVSFNKQKIENLMKSNCLCLRFDVISKSSATFNGINNFYQEFYVL